MKSKPINPIIQYKNIEGIETSYVEDWGMTLREHYAGLFMQSFITANEKQTYPEKMSAVELSERSIQYAETLIRELNNEQS